jgi:hypothetical protein
MNNSSISIIYKTILLYILLFLMLNNKNYIVWFKLLEYLLLIIVILNING